MKRIRQFFTLRQTKLRAFTLLECLVSLLVISGSILVYDALTQSLASHMTYLSDRQETDWLLFSQQIGTELAGCTLDKVSDNKLYVTKSNQSLAFGKSKADDFRKTNASGKGYQPMLFGVETVSMTEKDNLVTMMIVFTNGEERSFIYAFEKTP